MPDEISQLTEMLGELHGDIVDYIAIYNNQPAITSPAIIELGDSRYHKAIGNAYSQSGLLLLMASDQLIALTRTLGELSLTIAPWMCVRALLELTAVASWLVDPCIGVRERAERSYALRFEGLWQQKQFAEAAKEDAAPYVQLIENLAAAAAAVGISTNRQNNGKRKVIGDGWKTFTSLVALMLDEEANYRLFSAMTHGHAWAASQLGFHIEAGGAASPLAVSDSVPITKVLPPGGAASLCVVAAKNFSQLVRYKAQLFGWDGNRLADVVLPRMTAIIEIHHRAQAARNAAT
jgi:hypothetical protein